MLASNNMGVMEGWSVEARESTARLTGEHRKLRGKLRTARQGCSSGLQPLPPTMTVEMDCTRGLAGGLLVDQYNVFDPTLPRPPHLPVLPCVRLDAVWSAAV